MILFKPSLSHWDSFSPNLLLDDTVTMVPLRQLCAVRVVRKMVRAAMDIVQAALRSGTVRQYLAASAASVSVLMTGVAFTWVTQLLVVLVSPDSEVPMTREQSSWVVSLIEVGNMVTPLPAGVLVDNWGRKPCLLLTAPLYILTWLLVLGTRSVAVLYVVRFMQGVGMGVIFTVLPAYLGEISEPRHRGTLGTLFEVMWYLGVVLQYSIAPMVSYQTLALLSLGVPVFFLLAFACMPETPYFLLLRGQEKEAAEALRWLRGDSAVEAELKEMKMSVDTDLAESSPSSWVDLVSTPASRRCLLIVQVIVIMEVVSGIPAVLSYVTDALSHTHNKSAIKADQYTIIIGVSILFSTLVSAIFVDSLGRRPILLVSCFGAAICQLLTGVYFYVDQKKDGYDLSGCNWVAVSFISCYGVLLCGGCGAVSTVIQSELFPSHTRGLGNGVITMVMNVASFLCLKFYEDIDQAVGVYLNFWLYSFFGLLGTVFIYLYLPETKGKTFAEIQQVMAELNTPSKPEVKGVKLV